MTVLVTLLEQHLAYCDALALRRQQSAERNHRRGTNGAPSKGCAALENHSFGVRGECAAYLWLKPIKWHTFQEHDIASLPDLGDFIDVKTVKSPHHRLIVQTTSPEEWAYLLVSVEHPPKYAIEGWLWGWEAKIERYHSDPVGGRAAFFVPPRDLHPPVALKQILSGAKEA